VQLTQPAHYLARQHRQGSRRGEKGGDGGRRGLVRACKVDDGRLSIKSGGESSAQLLFVGLLRLLEA
jgi:hypothetical protein